MEITKIISYLPSLQPQSPVAIAAHANAR